MYSTLLTLAGLRAKAIRAEARAESLTLSPSLLMMFLDEVEHQLPPAVRTLVLPDGTPALITTHVYLGVLRDLAHDNRAAAEQRLCLAFDPWSSTPAALADLVDAIEADAQEGA